MREHKRRSFIEYHFGEKSPRKFNPGDPVAVVKGRLAGARGTVTLVMERGFMGEGRHYQVKIPRKKKAVVLPGGSLKLIPPHTKAEQLQLI